MCYLHSRHANYAFEGLKSFFFFFGNTRQPVHHRRIGPHPDPELKSNGPHRRTFTFHWIQGIIFHMASPVLRKRSPTDYPSRGESHILYPWGLGEGIWQGAMATSPQMRCQSLEKMVTSLEMCTLCPGEGGEEELMGPTFLCIEHGLGEQ